MHLTTAHLPGNYGWISNLTWLERKPRTADGFASQYYSDLQRWATGPTNVLQDREKKPVTTAENTLERVFSEHGSIASLVLLSKQALWLYSVDMCLKFLSSPLITASMATVITQMASRCCSTTFCSWKRSNLTIFWRVTAHWISLLSPASLAPHKHPRKRTTNSATFRSNFFAALGKHSVIQKFGVNLLNYLA